MPSRLSRARSRSVSLLSALVDGSIKERWPHASQRRNRLDKLSRGSAARSDYLEGHTCGGMARRRLCQRRAAVKWRVARCRSSLARKHVAVPHRTRPRMTENACPLEAGRQTCRNSVRSGNAGTDRHVRGITVWRMVRRCIGASTRWYRCRSHHEVQKGSFARSAGRPTHCRCHSRQPSMVMRQPTSSARRSSRRHGGHDQDLQHAAPRIAVLADVRSLPKESLQCTEAAPSASFGRR